MKLTTKRNYVFCGDNVEWLKEVPDQSVDLCYIDPPFFSNRNYEVIWGNGYELRAFGDRFAGGIIHYIEWMKERVQPIHRVLKNSGAIFLHCDWHASHRLRLLLDEIFGEDGFRNEIIWQRTPFSGSSKARAKRLPAIHDTILYYAKSREHDAKFQCPETDYSEEYKRRFNQKDERGFYQSVLLKTYSKETYERLKKEDRLILAKRGGKYPRYKYYLHESRQKTQFGDVWTDVNMLNPTSNERLGYPTQKPEALVRRVVEMASSKGDLILDCFAGGGTTAKVAADGSVREVEEFIYHPNVIRNLGTGEAVVAIPHPKGIKMVRLKATRKPDLLSVPLPQIEKHLTAIPSPIITTAPESQKLPGT